MVVRFHPTPQKLNDRMVRVYEGDALQMRLEKSTSGVRISLRSHLKSWRYQLTRSQDRPLSGSHLRVSGSRPGISAKYKISQYPNWYRGQIKDLVSQDVRVRVPPGIRK